MTQTTERPRAAGGGPGRNPFARAATFYRQVVAELRKVIWPTRDQLVAYTIVALIFVSAMVAIVAALDVGFAHLVLAVFG